MIASLPPLVASYRPDTQLPHEQAISEYRELIALQKRLSMAFWLKQFLDQ